MLTIVSPSIIAFLNFYLDSVTIPDALRWYVIKWYDCKRWAKV